MPEEVGLNIEIKMAVPNDSITSPEEVQRVVGVVWGAEGCSAAPAVLRVCGVCAEALGVQTGSTCSQGPSLH